MATFTKRMIVPVLLVVAVIVAAALAGLATGSAGADPVDATTTAPEPDSNSMAAATDAPEGDTEFDLMLSAADYVSEDGSYVRFGDVEISAAPVLTRLDG